MTMPDPLTRCRTIRLLITLVGGVLVAALVSFAPFPTLAAEREHHVRSLPNLLEDPSLEVIYHRKPRTLLWLNWNEATHSVEKDTVHGHDTAVAATGKGLLLQRRTLLPGVEYEASVWVKVTDAGGRGAWVEVIPGHRGTGEVIARSEPADQVGDWQRSSVRFTLPGENQQTVQVRVAWDLGDGGRAVVDDVSLTPVEGELPITPAPKLTPDGGEFGEPVHVEMSTDLPGATIRYTVGSRSASVVDGLEPHPFSPEYKVPVLVNTNQTIRARVFHDAYRPGEITEATFRLPPRRGPGVPRYTIDWTTDVDQWWAGHFYNTKSPNHVTEITSPEPRINVADVRDAHPDTQTAGIAEALDELPESGGTLYFPKDRGPYVITQKESAVTHLYKVRAAMQVLRRSHLHFVSDGAVIRCGEVAFMHICSMDIADRGHPMFPAMNPVTNFYFKGLTFDGDGSAIMGLRFNHAHDVLIEDCTFRNFRDELRPGERREITGMPGLIAANMACENIWARRCTFESGLVGSHMDGMFGGGVVDCNFGRGLTHVHVVFFPNTDLNCTRRLISPRMRISHYCVISGCTFEGAGRRWQKASDANVADFLVTGNTVRNFHLGFVLKTLGMPGHNWPHAFPAAGYRVIGNRFEQVQEPLLLHHGVARGRRGQGNLFAENTGIGTNVFFQIDKLRTPVYDVTVTRNRFSGEHLPQAALERDKLDWMHDVEIIENTLGGEQRPMVVDVKGQPLDVAGSGVRVEDNSVK